MVASILLWAFLAAPDDGFGAAARRFADFMLEHGRDRYGPVHSPLFAGALLIEIVPDLLPDAIYGDESKGLDPRTVQNLPNIYRSDSLAHKITYRGGDLADDVGLMRLLYALTARTGDRRYSDAADEAIRWFLSHCIVPETGLPAWGEHSGWDFRRERPDLVNPRYSHHEFDSWWPLYDRFAALSPEPERGKWTVLERWSRALWEGAVFARNGRLLYCRHSPLFVRKRPRGAKHGDYGMFPRHAGYYVWHWAVALAHSRNPAFHRYLRPRVERFLNMLESQIRTHGYPVYEENGEPRFAPDQVASLASSLDLAAERLPAFGPRLRRLAAQCDQALGERGAPVSASESLARLKARPDGPWADYFRRRFFGEADRLSRLETISERVLAAKGRRFNQPGRIPLQYAEAIDVLLEAAELRTARSEYLGAARRLGREAMLLFLPPDSPLPRSLDRTPLLLDGRDFPHYYHSYLGGDDLMWSFFRLEEALQRAAAESEGR